MVKETKTLYIKGVGLHELIAENLTYAESQQIAREIENGKRGESILYHITHQINSGGVDVGNNTYAVYQLIVDKGQTWQHTTKSGYGNARDIKDDMFLIQRDLEHQLCNLKIKIDILYGAAVAGLLYTIWIIMRNLGMTEEQCIIAMLALGLIVIAGCWANCELNKCIRNN